mgnify:CR=1 FL=1
MLKAKKNSMCIDVTGVDDMTDRHTLMEEIIRRNISKLFFMDYTLHHAH